jgi:hypothetical protein
VPAVARRNKCGLCHQEGHTKPTCPNNPNRSTNTNRSASAISVTAPISGATPVSREKKRSRAEIDGGEDANDSESDNDEVNEHVVINVRDGGDDSDDDSDENEAENSSDNDGSKWSEVQIRGLDAIFQRENRQITHTATAEHTLPTWNNHSAAGGASNTPNGMGQTPEDYFSLFFTPGVIDTFVAQSNTYAIDTRRYKWRSLTNTEFKTFLAIVAYLGITKYADLDTAWHELYGSVHIKAHMTKWRFHEILRCWHYQSNALISRAERANKNKADPFWVVRGFLTHLNTQFGSMMNLGQKICIDESCFSFKGRHRARCYNPNKPAKWHFKAFCLNDSTTGYLHNFRMYSGKDEERPAGMAATEWPVHELTRDPVYHNKGHILATDNWYTSINIVKHLYSKGINFLGTVRANKKDLPKPYIYTKKGKAKKQRGEMSSVYQEMTLDDGTKVPVYFISWMDNKPVHLLSTSPTYKSIVERVSKELGVYQGKKNIDIPTTIIVYNSTMGGTDKFDQLISYYHTMVSSTRWPVRIFTQFFHASIVNAHILYKLNHPRITRNDVNFTLLSFTRSLIASMGTPLATITAETMPRGVKSSDPIRHQGTHMPMLLRRNRDNDGKQSDYRRHCKICNERVPSMCATCNIGLCFSTNRASALQGDSCWERWHNPAK